MLIGFCTKTSKIPVGYAINVVFYSIYVDFSHEVVTESSTVFTLDLNSSF